MPSRRRPKAPAATPMSDAARFAQALRDSAEADRRAKAEAQARKEAAARAAEEAAAHARRLAQAKADHQRAVEMVREANRSGKGVAAADAAWRQAKAALIEAETGRPPAWAKPAADRASAEDVDGPGDDEHDGSE